MLGQITKLEFQACFEKTFFKANRANRLDMHWNSQPHINQTTQIPETTNVETVEETKESNEAAAAQSENQEPEVIPTYETQLEHGSLNAFKKSVGLFADNFLLNFTTTV